MTERYQRVRMDDLRHMNLFEKAEQPALRNWQSKVYDKGPYQIPDYESFAAIVQEHEQMATHIERLTEKLKAAVNASKYKD